MKCPYCGYKESKVADSRATDEGERIRRRRECLQCGRRFTTYEIVETTPIMVRKRDGTQEPFDKSKLLFGLMRACEKRPISMEDLEKIVNEVENVPLTLTNKEISSEMIGEISLSQLKELDQVAYIRFASVYRKFNDVNSFLEELENLKSTQKE